MSLLQAHFPEVVKTIDDCAEGLLHPEMGAFSRATQAAIDRQDLKTVQRHFQFIDEAFRDAAPDVENAINVSYLENLRFNERTVGAQARELLPPRLQQALIELEKYLENLADAKKIN